MDYRRKFLTLFLLFIDKKGGKFRLNVLSTYIILYLKTYRIRLNLAGGKKKV